MFKIERINIKSFVANIIVLAILVPVSIVNNVNPLLALVLLTWFYLVIKSIQEYNKNSAFLLFLIAFFIFLLGREVSFYYFNYPIYYEYLMKYDDQTYICLFCSLVFLFLGNNFFIRSELKSDRISTYNSRQIKEDAYGKACKLSFYVCLVAGLATAVITLSHVRQIGYVESYSAENIDAGIPFFMKYMAAFLVTMFCLYLATKPKKRDVIIASILMEVYAITVLLAGSRFTFVGISMLILIYFTIRQRGAERWLPKHLGLWIILAAIIIMIFLSMWDALRTNTEYHFGGLFLAIRRFLVEQGGSVNCIKRVFYYSEQISDMHLVSFSSLRTILFENSIVRNILNIQVFEGNSIEHALYGHSLSHRLSFYEYGERYLLGHGVGSSYIAELYHDFSYIGVAIGSFIYGLILRRVSNITFENKMKDGILLMMTYYLMHVPRGSFDEFLSNLLNIYTVLSIIIVLCLTQIFRMRMRKVLIFDNNKKVGSDET